MLNALGGGKRYRGRAVRPLSGPVPVQRGGAAPSRRILFFDPQRVRSHVEQGWWRSDTLSGWLRRTARERPDGAALGGRAGHRLICGARREGRGRLRPGSTTTPESGRATWLPSSFRTCASTVEILLAVSAPRQGSPPACAPASDNSPRTGSGSASTSARAASRSIDSVTGVDTCAGGARKRTACSRSSRGIRSPGRRARGGRDAPRSLPGASSDALTLRTLGVEVVVGDRVAKVHHAHEGSAS